MTKMQQNMTVNELYRQGCDTLANARVEDVAFDARCLLEKALQVNTSRFFMLKDSIAEPQTIANYLAWIQQRANGEPLQYILGEWEFMGHTFAVGNGVLIPRPETELVVEFADRFLSGKKEPIVLDLCAGSGCIGISIAKIYPNATIYAVEKSPEAFSFLEKNVKINQTKNVIAVNGDITDCTLLSEVKPDLIVSNPPYIKTDDIPFLQYEVRQEPAMALDGGEDGYDFYRILTEIWLPRFVHGGAMAVECAEDQTDCIAQMFRTAGFRTNVVNDCSGLPRMVTAFDNHD